MLFDASHKGNRRLSLQDINIRPAINLHQFYWLADAEIGELDPAWNWLVNEQPRPDNLALAHFTLGGPFTPDWRGAEHDDIWLKAAQ